MSDLPKREMAQRAIDDGYAGLVVWKLVRAYVSGELQTADEWREDISYEAAIAYCIETGVEPALSRIRAPGIVRAAIEGTDEK